MKTLLFAFAFLFSCASIAQSDSSKHTLVGVATPDRDTLYLSKTSDVSVMIVKAWDMDADRERPVILFVSDERLAELWDLFGSAQPCVNNKRRKRNG